MLYRELGQYLKFKAIPLYQFVTYHNHSRARKMPTRLQSICLMAINSTIIQDKATNLPAMS